MAQSIGQLELLEDEHPACTILAHVAEHDAATWAGEQLPPQVASGPASRSWLLTAPPHPTAAQRLAHAAMQAMKRKPTALMRPSTAGTLPTPGRRRQCARK